MDEKQALLEKWTEIKEQIKIDNDVTDLAYDTWIKPMKIHSVDNGIVRILVPPEQETGINYISNKYKLPLSFTISEVMQTKYDVEFITEADAAKEKTVTPSNKKELNHSNLEQTIQKSNLNPKYTFDTFVVGQNNSLAHSAAVAVAEDPGKVYNPLFLYGGPGLGKTHLMHSIGHHIIKRNPNTIVRYVTSESFTNELIESIRNGEGATAMSKFREKYRSVDVLLLDDVQFIIGKESTQNEFFNTFNELHSQNKAIILTSDKPPKDMETLEERLRSRFDWGLTVDINPPDYETRMAILRQYAETIGITIDDEIVQYIASNIRSNIRELEGALNKVVALKNLTNQEITMSTAEQAIKDMITPDTPRTVTPEIILDVVANYYNTTKEAIASGKRNKEIVIPRQVAMYICREKTDAPLIEIGKVMGNRDHTTVIHGHDKVAKDLSTNPNLKDDIDKIIKMIYPN
ncbi:chromosomal replication initiator protein DnaA [Lachnospiraceae bacterium]|nr:chromosomal replication initiator protein DnaA [Lachnospiraceae bacterium]